MQTVEVLDANIPKTSIPPTHTDTDKESAPISKNASDKRIPGLSLAALKQKNAIKRAKANEETAELPTDSFTEEEFYKVWNDYIAVLAKKNKHIVHAMLSENLPILKGTDILLTFSNQTMKNDLLYEKLDLMNYIRKALNNYDIELVITVNEAVKQKVVYSAQERFEHLAEKNPTILALKKAFKLDY